MTSPSLSSTSHTTATTPSISSEGLQRILNLSDSTDSEINADPQPQPVPPTPPLSDPPLRVSPIEVAQHGQIWRFIPPGCNKRWIETVSPILRSYKRASDSQNAGLRAQLIDHLMLLPAICLTKKRGGHRAHRRLSNKLSLYAQVLRKQEDPTLAVRPQEPEEVAIPPEAPAGPEAAQIKKIRRAVQYARRGYLSRAAKCLTQSGLASIDDEAVQALQDLHPDYEGELPQLPADHQPLVAVNTESMIKAIKQKVANGAAPGPSGWTGEMLLPLLKDQTCTEGLAALVLDMTNDCLDAHSKRLLTSSLLLGIPKKNSRKLRPLALGETLLKVASTYCYQQDRPAFQDIFGDLQLAVCAKGGSERAVRANQAAAELNPTRHIAITADTSNAFNTLDRGKMLETVFNHEDLTLTKGMYAFTYSEPSLLIIRENNQVKHVLLSRNGVRQGCVLGSLGYALTLQPAYEESTHGLREVTTKAIMDDITWTGPPNEVFAAYERYVASAARLGLTVNASKTRVQQFSGEPSAFTRSKAHELHLNIAKGNCKHLGAMIGVDKEEMATFVREQLNKQEPILNAIKSNTCPAQLALQLARVCALPRPNYLMRSMPMYATIGPLEEFDNSLRQAVFSRFNLPQPLPEPALLTLNQPIRNGGIGFRSMSLVVPAAAWSSYVQASEDIMEILHRSELRHDLPENYQLPSVSDKDNCYEMLKNLGCPTTVQENDNAEPDEDEWIILPSHPTRFHLHYVDCDPRLRVQRLLTAFIEDNILQNYKVSPECSDLQLARINACSARYTGLWLVVPVSSPEFCLTDSQLAIALRLRLGLSPLPEHLLPSTCLCKKDIAADLWHAMACPKVRRLAVNVRHDKLLRLFARFVKGNSSISVERPDPSGKRPDATVYLHSQSVITDVTVCHPTALSIRRQAATGAPCRVANDRAAQKHNKYRHIAERLGHDFLAMSLETYGGYSSSSLKLLKLIAKEASSPLLGIPNHHAMSKSSFMRLASVCMQRENANIVTQWLDLNRRSGNDSQLQPQRIQPPQPAAAAPSPHPSQDSLATTISVPSEVINSINFSEAIVWPSPTVSPINSSQQSASSLSRIFTSQRTLFATQPESGSSSEEVTPVRLAGHTISQGRARRSVSRPKGQDNGLLSVDYFINASVDMDAEYVDQEQASSQASVSFEVNLRPREQLEEANILWRSRSTSGCFVSDEASFTV